MSRKKNVLSHQNRRLYNSQLQAINASQRKKNSSRSWSDTTQHGLDPTIHLYSVTYNKAKRRESDARWRANISYCFDVMRSIIPGSGDGVYNCKRIPKIVALHQTLKHIDFLNELGSKLLNELAERLGSDVDDEDQCPRMVDIKEQFICQQTSTDVRVIDDNGEHVKEYMMKYFHKMHEKLISGNNSIRTYRTNRTLLGRRRVTKAFDSQIHHFINKRRQDMESNLHEDLSNRTSNLSTRSDINTPLHRYFINQDKEQNGLLYLPKKLRLTASNSSVVMKPNYYQTPTYISSITPVHCLTNKRSAMANTVTSVNDSNSSAAEIKTMNMGGSNSDVIVQGPRGNNGDVTVQGPRIIRNSQVVRRLALDEMQPHCKGAALVKPPQKKQQESKFGAEYDAQEDTKLLCFEDLDADFDKCDLDSDDDDCIQVKPSYKRRCLPLENRETKPPKCRKRLDGLFRSPDTKAETKRRNLKSLKGPFSGRSVAEHLDTCDYSVPTREEEGPLSFESLWRAHLGDLTIEELDEYRVIDLGMTQDRESWHQTHKLVIKCEDNNNNEPDCLIVKTEPEVDLNAKSIKMVKQPSRDMFFFPCHEE